MLSIGDIIERDGVKHIVTKAGVGKFAKAETMPVRKYIEESYILHDIDGDMTIAEFISREAQKLIDGKVQK